MKTKYITLAVALLFSLYVPAQAQSDEGSIWDGIEGTLTNIFDNTIQGTEAGRLFMLFNSDISMIMKAHNNSELLSFPIGVLDLGTFSGASDASMTAEFDWDNKALSMHLKKSATDHRAGLAAGSDGFSLMTEKTNAAIDQYQYTDKDGYWYTPYVDPNYVGTGETFYVKFNAKRAARGVAAGLSEADLEHLSDKIYSTIRELLGPQSTGFGITYGPQLDEIIQGAIHGAESARDGIRNLLNSRYLSIVGFPVFIHWAFLYSPDFIRARFNVTETTVNYFDYVNNSPAFYTKLTVASGKERGKSMIFDQYNRLIYIDSKRDGSVQFFYDRDLTVRLPAARKMSDIIGYYIESSNRGN